VANTNEPSEPGNDFGHTVILPNPAGRRAPQTAPRPDPSIEAQIREIGINPIAAAAAPLLILAARLRNTPAHSDLPGLRARVLREVQAFEKRATDAGTPADAVRASKYALCATIDDVIQNTPWGGGNVWASHSMVVTFFNEVSGGKRFFDILQNLEKDLVRFAPVLELMFLCLSIGFDGMFRVQSRGAAELEQLRDRLFHLIRQQRHHFEPELSPHWRGIAATHRPLSAAIPIWVLALATVVLLTVVYAGFSYALNGQSDRAFTTLASLPPQGEVRLIREVPPPPPPVRPALLPRVRKFLEPEIAQGLVTVFEDGQSLTVRIRNDGMFEIGSDEVAQRYLPILTRVGQALDEEDGNVIVTGHTDNVPIHTLRFPSNWHLSLARAEVVKDILAKNLRDAARLSVVGRATAEPIANNATPEGRAQNRRIEVVLMKTAGEPKAVGTTPK
jgi:type VI secretion system protein ImpK